MGIKLTFLLSLCGTQLCHLLFSCLRALVKFVQSATAVGGQNREQSCSDYPFNS